MFRVYAKIGCIVALLFVAVSGLGGCVTGSAYAPWNASGNVGVVTKDKDSIPDIAWQTPGQRQTLIKQNAVFVQEQAAQPPAPAPAQPSAEPVSRKVKVALLVPLSGKNADLGQSMMKAAQMALFDVGSGYFELVPKDTESTKEGAAKAAQQAIDDHADMILGPVFADDVRAVKPIASSANIPLVTFTTDWTLAGGDTYVMGFMPFAQVSRAVQYAVDHGYHRFAAYAPQTDYGDIAVSTLNRTSAQVVKVTRFSPQQPDWDMLVDDFAHATRTSGDKGAKEQTFSFDGMLLPVGGENLKSLISMLDLNGIKAENIKFIGTGLWDDPALTGQAGLFGGWFAAPDPRLRRDFEKRYQDNYGAAPLRLASLAYDATALAAVLARTRGEEGANGSPFTREHLTNPRGFAGIDGIFRFRSDGIAERGLAVLEMQSGAAKVIDPAPTAFIAPGGG